MRMLALSALAALIPVFAAGTCANAAAWCAFYQDSITNCGFYTIEQCQAAVSGLGGYCGANPQAPEYPARTRPKAR
jgi:Protein of unknown function (DUF3551)